MSSCLVCATSKSPRVEYQKPVYVKAGSESQEQIGPPPVPEYELTDLKDK
jgi:hypothetical protein